MIPILATLKKAHRPFAWSVFRQPAAPAERQAPDQSASQRDVELACEHGYPVFALRGDFRKQAQDEVVVGLVGTTPRKHTEYDRAFTLAPMDALHVPSQPPHLPAHFRTVHLKPANWELALAEIQPNESEHDRHCLLAALLVSPENLKIPSGA